MGLDERDYVRGKHPPACTCVGCQQRRLRRRSGDDPVWKRQKILSVSRRRHAQINFKPLIAWLITVGLVLGSIFALGCPVAPEPTPEYPPPEPVTAPEPIPEPPPTEPAIAPKPGPRDIVDEANFEAIDYHALDVPEDRTRKHKDLRKNGQTDSHSNYCDFGGGSYCCRVFVHTGERQAKEHSD